MSTTEVRAQRGYILRMVLISIAGMVALYFYLGYLPVEIWVLAIALVIVLLFRALRGRSRSSGPCIILDEQGVFDKRLKIGVIRWADIRRVYGRSLQGAEYVCLELHDKEAYEARRPRWQRLLFNVYRIFGMSTIAISTSGLDMDSETLQQKIHEGCEAQAEKIYHNETETP